MNGRSHTRPAGRDFDIGDLNTHLGANVLNVFGDADVHFDHPTPLGKADPGAVTFSKAEGQDLARQLASISGGVVVICSDRSVAADAPSSSMYVVVENPRLEFIRLLNALFSPPREVGIHSSATIHPSSVVHESASIGAGVVIDHDCEIDEDVVIHPNVTVRAASIVGARTVIFPGAVLGADGFGFERTPSGELVRFLHFGRVVVGADVEIGANACIDRGTMGDTVIGSGVKIDNHVHISHNVDVGEHSVLIAHVVICGSVRIGPRAWISPAACILNDLRVGADTTIGAGAIVWHDIPDGATVAGYPSRLVRAKREEH